MTVYGPDYEVDARQSSRSLTDEERQKLVVYLHSGAVGSWDWDKIANWDATKVIDWGMDSDALKDWKRDVTALDSLISSEGNGQGTPPPPESAYKEQYGVIVICADATDQERVYNELTELGMVCKVVVT